LSFEHLDAVDVAFDGAGAPGETEAVGDGVLVGAQAGDGGAECGLAGGVGGGHPRLGQLAAAALVHDGGEVAGAGGDGGQFRDGVRLRGKPVTRHGCYPRQRAATTHQATARGPSQFPGQRDRPMRSEVDKSQVS